MSRTRLLSFIAVSLFAVSTSAAHADTVDTFHVTGPGYDLTFGVPAPPIPSSYTADSFTVPHVHYVLNNGSFLTVSDFRFYSTGGYEFDVGTEIFGAGGPKLFTGTTAMPTFLTGTFEVIGGGLDGKPGSGLLQLTITQEPTPTPEPSTLALLGTGIMGLAAVARFEQRNAATFKTNR